MFRRGRTQKVDAIGAVIGVLLVLLLGSLLSAMGAETSAAHRHLYAYTASLTALPGGQVGGAYVGWVLDGNGDGNQTDKGLNNPSTGGRAWSTSLPAASVRGGCGFRCF
jgi:hypothetical protein